VQEGNEPPGAPSDACRPGWRPSWAAARRGVPRLTPLATEKPSSLTGNSSTVWRKPPAVLCLVAFCGLQAVLAIASVSLGYPFLNYQPPYWRTLLIYGCGAPYVGYLCWRQAPRARFAIYVFLSVDVLRAIRGGHWGGLLISLTPIIAMQLPAWRAAYPAIQPRDVGRRLRRVVRRPVPPDSQPGSNPSGT
jgi:hypothetical protein